MKPLTMTEEDERTHRCDAGSECADSDTALALLGEVDALRAKLAEVEDAFTKFAVAVFAESIAAQADAVIVGDVKRTEADSLAALVALARRHRALRAQLAETKLNEDMATGIFIELHDVLSAQPCACGSTDHKSTPPMMYREWLLSVLAKRDMALAASQAEACALREALGRIAGMSHVSEVGSRGDVARKALATPSGSDAALREACRKVALKSWFADMTVEDSIDAILGPPATGASEGGEA